MDPDSSAKTVLFENVPPENFDYLWMFLNNGNRKLKSFKAESESRSVLVTFVDKDVSDKLLRVGSLKMLSSDIKVIRPSEARMNSSADHSSARLNLSLDDSSARLNSSADESSMLTSADVSILNETNPKSIFQQVVETTPLPPTPSSKEQKFENNLPGLNLVVESPSEEARAVVSVEEDNIEQRNSNRTESIRSLKPHQIKMAGHLKTSLEAGGLKFEMIDEDVIKFHGSYESIKDAKLKLYQKLLTLERKTIKISDTVTKLLERESVKRWLNEKIFPKETLTISWGEEAGVIYAFSVNELNLAEEGIKGSIVEQRIEARKISGEEFPAEVVRMQDSFIELSKDLEKNNGNIAVVENTFVITAFNLQLIVDSVVKELKDIFEEVLVRKETVDDCPGIDKYFLSYAGKHGLLGIQAKHKVVIGHCTKFVAVPVSRISSGNDFPGLSNNNAGPPSSAVRTKNGIVVTIVKDSLQEQQVDVIVNSTSQGLHLKSGEISSSILRAAGDEILTECKQRGNVEWGEIVVTDGYKLPCKAVYHGALKAFQEKKPEESVKMFKSLVLKCLIQADKDKRVSIAFPVLGTGNLSFPCQVVAKAMYEVVESFSKDYPKTTVKDIRFVIKETKSEKLDAFEKEQEDALMRTESWRPVVVRQALVPFSVSVELTLHCCSKLVLDVAFKEIIDSYKNSSTVETLEDTTKTIEFLENLSDRQVKSIENLQHEHSVKIVLEEPPYAAKKLTVQGLTNDVFNTMQAIQLIMEPETPGSSLYARSLGYILVQKQ